MAKKVFGLAAIQVAPIASDGDIGTDWASVGETVSGTASMSQDDNTVTDFSIEESDSPVESVVTAAGKVTIAWSSYNIGYFMLKKLFGGTGNLKQSVGSINVLGALTGGSGYAGGGSGYFENVPLTGGTGTGATANIKVVAGVITAIELTSLGAGYAAANSLSAVNTNLGGSGTGFAQVVTSVFASATAEQWFAPDSFDDVELSLKVTDKKGNVTLVPRTKISSKLGLSYSKDKLGQMDMSATIMQPTKLGVKRLTLQMA